MLSRSIKQIQRRSFSILTFSFASFSFKDTPSPPKLPKEQQKEFEKLQLKATSQLVVEEYNNKEQEKEPATLYFKTIPEFEGEVNPKTGEVGGPKQDPIRHGDWSFNGRVTDF